MSERPVKAGLWSSRAPFVASGISLKEYEVGLIVILSKIEWDDETWNRSHTLVKLRWDRLYMLQKLDDDIFGCDVHEFI
jgi:hypothetical protein